MINKSIHSSFWSKNEEVPEKAVLIVVHPTFLVWVNTSELVISETLVGFQISKGLYAVPLVARPSRWQAKKQVSRWCIQALVSQIVRANKEENLPRLPSSFYRRANRTNKYAA